MNSVVLWYDIGRQGATNESMAASPILKDLSGNGNDATCYNFGWTEESGINSTNYPGALVSDGVDDYAFVQDKYDDEGNLINKKSLVLNKEDGYTVIAKRKWIGNINARVQGVASKISNTSFADGAFGFEEVENNGTVPFNRSFSTGYSKGFLRVDNFVSDDFTFMTSKRYNSVEFENIGDGVDTDVMVIFRLATTINNYYSSIALDSFILFNRDLTDEEIEWVKNNLIQ